VIPVRRETVDIVALLRSCLAVVQDQARADGIEIRIDVEGEPPAAMAIDPEKIAWAVTTLVGNSMRYVRRATRSDGGGSILLQVGVDQTAAELTIAVHDDGPGIPPEKLARLFARADRALHAAGLALVLVRDVVDAHGGRLQVESRTESDEHGTSITIRIPLRQPPQQPVKP
jgi:signal transduction histidine kinase